MPPLQPIKEKSNPDAMIWNASATSCSTCLKALSHGKDFPVDPRTRSMLPSRRRRSRPLSKTCAVVSPPNSKNLWSTAVLLNSSKSPTTRPAWPFSRAACSVSTSTQRSTTTHGSKIGLPRTKSP